MNNNMMTHAVTIVDQASASTNSHDTADETHVEDMAVSTSLDLTTLTKSKPLKQMLQEERNVLQYYKIGKVLGKGAYSHVRAAECRQTGA